MPAGILACYGLFDGLDAVGSAVFSNGRIQYDKKYLEFARLWVSDKYKRNVESWFIAKCVKALKKKFPTYRGIVTWADCNRGHRGTVYLASNFVFDGNSRAVKKYKGSNKKVIYQRTATKDSVLISTDEPKKRFIYYFKPRISLKHGDLRLPKTTT